ncbi:hypothetical protein [Marinitenerispora sediminis]|uniref:Uncharacterized protein n=1 Tax=Marinitenerispora sediminis TaxID=1931232 RepID=A0A368T6A9_9ACTN|nr:hypothetical protein [Marinitenerispora sediminis]RCV49722.1 hypothetical protein DEF23_23220 [Marinitenerispora sediminis]RCV59269.1 hypothetical protein DEF24_09865 [Marinitenerispora sediminis]
MSNPHDRVFRFQRVGLHRDVPDLPFPMCLASTVEDHILAHIRPYLVETAPLIFDAHPDVREGRAYIHKGGEELVLAEFTVHLPDEDESEGNR